MAFNCKWYIHLIFVGLMIGCQGQNLSIQPESSTLSNDFDRNPPYEYKMPSQLSSIDTSDGWTQDGQKILLTGTVFLPDAKTPAAGIVLYYYHTDVHGIYAMNPAKKYNMPKNELGQTHGYLRGWIKTDSTGRYEIYTILPGAYPGRGEPKHIHVYIKESDQDLPYYIDDFVFDEDPLLTSAKRNKLENRGGSGVIRFGDQGGLLIGERNIILGLNVKGYQKGTFTKSLSGKNIGEEVLSFTPYHAFGPDKGTKTCPVCKYGWFHGIVYFVGNGADWSAIKKWLVFLESESEKRKEYLKVYLVYGNDQNYSKADRIKRLEELGVELKLKNTALTFVPSLTDQESEVYLNAINQEVENTILVYRRNTIIAKYVNAPAIPANFTEISKLLDETSTGYFKLPRPIYEE
ncbi:MAG TPA: hypothetical protein PKD18_20085 [Saprospiraceae bacterium]|mgnify:CR=1 FL=1|nr:hypothetical protein [Saprospiraceae bacterium]